MALSLVHSGAIRLAHTCIQSSMLSTNKQSLFVPQLWSPSVSCSDGVACQSAGQARRLAVSASCKQQCPPLRNEYWLLRHGTSKANEAGIIVSKREQGIKPEYSLADKGKQQAKEAGETLALSLRNSDTQDIYLYCSPFSRTRETAALAAAGLGWSSEDPRIETVEELRERDFGTLDLQSHEKYVDIWTEDAKSSKYHPPGQGESVAEVATRALQLRDRLEQKHDGCHIVLVSHGDTLSILWAAFTGGSLLSNRQHGLVTGELRRLDPLHLASRTIDDLG